MIETRMIALLHDGIELQGKIHTATLGSRICSRQLTRKVRILEGADGSCDGCEPAVHVVHAEVDDRNLGIDASKPSVECINVCGCMHNQRDVHDACISDLQILTV
jgi:hypothetical protein